MLWIMFLNLTITFAAYDVFCTVLFDSLSVFSSLVRPSLTGILSIITES